MSSHASIGVERKIEHTFFLLSVWSKGVAGLIETIGGLLFLLIPQTGLNAFVIALTAPELAEDRKSTRLNSSHLVISYAVFCLKKKKYIISAAVRTILLATSSDFLKKGTINDTLHICF